ncbi:hypothetical protein PoB_003646000 [Plakobranchus ocellatus]|uniref:Uncharacterized protein n=1 Tax=Plakobranchus ocellatus TaxID=259542 RepID=A0AAV4ANW8_9GAST|nr:hypothetical protein PoB_003646000 [Plakobranchus ocellatus]
MIPSLLHNASLHLSDFLNPVFLLSDEQPFYSQKEAGPVLTNLKIFFASLTERVSPHSTSGPGKLSTPSKTGNVLSAHNLPSRTTSPGTYKCSPLTQRSPGSHQERLHIFLAWTS